MTQYKPGNGGNFMHRHANYAKDSSTAPPPGFSSCVKKKYSSEGKYHSTKPENQAIEKAKKLNYKLKDAKDWKGIMRQIECHLDAFNEVNIATALHRLAKIARDSNDKGRILRDPRLMQLEVKAQETIKLFTPQQLSNSAWACGTLSYHANSLLKAIENEALLKLDKFNSQDLTNTIWAYAKLNYRPKQLMNGIAQEALLKLSDFNPQGLANTLWAFATLNYFGENYPDLLAGIAEESSKKITQFNPQNLANSAWAYARLSYHPGEKLLRRISEQAIDKMELFKPQELANLIWAMAKLDYSCEELLKEVSKAADYKLHKYNPQNLANTCWAYAILGYYPGPIMGKIVDRAQCCLSDFSQQGLSNTVWALAKLGYNPGEVFLRSVSYEATKKITSFSPQGLVNLAWAFACFGKYYTDLMNIICREASSKLHAFNTQDIANLTWALAKFGHHPKDLLQEICMLSDKRLAYFTSPELVDMIHSLTCLHLLNMPVSVKMWEMATAMIFSTKELCVIHSAIEVMIKQGGVPLYLNPNLVVRAQKAISLESEGINDVQESMSKMSVNQNGAAIKPNLSVQTIDERKLKEPTVFPENWHSPQAGLLMRMESLQKSDSFNLTGEQMVSSILETPHADKSRPNSTLWPISQYEGQENGQTDSLFARQLKGLDTGDQAYLSIWQSYAPKPVKTEKPEYARLPSGRDLVTPRSNLLSALSLDSSSQRVTTFENVLSGYRT